MKRTNPPLLGTATLLAALCALASPAAALPSSSSSRAASTSVASTSTPAGGLQTTSTANDDEVCFCTATYSDGTEEAVDACSRSECPDMEEYGDCQNLPATGICRLLETCDCDCRSTELVVDEYYDQDVFLAGVPNLWQFDYRCGAFGMNAVGCGPVAASMVMYWWAEQGYEGLVEDFLSGSGSSAADREHEWRGMVESFRDDYLNGGICVSDQYATLQGTMRDGIDEYIADAGYDAAVDHYKVCDGCNRNASDEISAATGLDIILDELRDGRPVILGFNAGRAMGSQATYESDFLGDVTAYTGELSNGTPAAGIISHYAVITGYVEAEGQDILLLNLGWEGWEDVAFVWNLAGKWAHLYTVDMQDRPDGAEFCAIDRGLSDTFVDSADLDLSCDWGVAPDTVLAGTSCGIVRNVIVSEYYPQWSGVSFECDPFAGLHDVQPLDTNEQFGHSGSSGLNTGSNAPILDELLPNP